MNCNTTHYRANSSSVPGDPTFAYSHNPSVASASALVGAGSLSLSLTADQPNSFTDMNWATTSVVFVASAPSTELRLTSQTAGAAGVFFDAVRVQQLVVQTNEVFNYAVFTDNTNLARVPIKFATPPFGSNTIIAGGTVFNSGFEGVPRGIYPNGAGVDGWTVSSNQVEVTDVGVTPDSGTNYLALSSGSIRRTVATQAGRRYLLTWASRNNGVVSWWPGDSAGSAKDVLGANSGTIQGAVPPVPGQIQSAFSFDGNGSNYIDLADTASLNVATNGGLTIEAWIKPDSFAEEAFFQYKLNPREVGVHILINGQLSGPGSIFANLIESDIGGPLAHHFIYTPSNILSTNAFQHIALTWDKVTGQASIYLNGSIVISSNMGSIFPSTTRGATVGRRIGVVGSPAWAYDGLIDDLALYHRALTATEIKALANAPTTGKYSSYSIQPNLHLTVGAAATNVVGGDAWTTNSYSFQAGNASTTIEFSGNALGMLLDSVQLTLIPETNSIYYLPEEPIKPLIGQNALGDWRLEVWDTRAGAAVGANLISWNLQLTFAPSAINLVVLTNGLAYTNSVVLGQTRYFAVDVPTDIGFTTNTLLSLTGGPLDLYFNPDQLPFLSLGGDVQILAAVSASDTAILNNSGAPPSFISGQRYFLAIRNVNPAQSNQFVIRVDFSTQNTNGITFVPLSSGIGVVTNIVATTNFQYYSFAVSPLVDSLRFELQALSGDADLYVTQAPRVPSLTVYDYASFNAGTANELINVLSNSVPVPASPGTWYLAVRNFAAAGTINYTIVATEIQRSFASGGLKILRSQFTVATGLARIPIETTPGRTYRVDWSSDLQVWHPLATFLAQQPKTLIEDPAPSEGQSARFYRVVQLP